MHYVRYVCICMYVGGVQTVSLWPDDEFAFISDYSYPRGEGGNIILHYIVLALVSLHIRGM